MKLTPGKLAGLKRVSNERGVIAAAAMDQRGSLQKSLAKEKGGEVTDVSFLCGVSRTRARTSIVLHATLSHAQALPQAVPGL